MSRPADSAILSCRDVGLHYHHTRSLTRRQPVQVLDGVSFDLHHSEALGIIGRNGAGKSSLLRLLAGIFPPDRGSIVHHGDHTISLLTLNLGFEQYLTGRENAMLGCLLMGLRRQQAARLLPEIIEFSGLGDAIDHPLLTYSSGMNLRLGFSIAFFTRSDVMLIDEVLGVGDHDFQVKSREALLSAVALRHTAVLASHDDAFLADFCDRLLWLENGRMVMHGAPDEVLAQYHRYLDLTNKLAEEAGTTAEQVRDNLKDQNPLEIVQQPPSGPQTLA